MVVVRPVQLSDLDGLTDLASLAGVGLTTLPRDRELLSARIRKSMRSFDKLPDRPGGEAYLFVMEETDAHRLVGACGIVSKVGGFQPFWGYRIETSLFESKQLGVREEVPMLVLVEEHDGPCEIGSLFLHPDYRKGGNGRLLQCVRFLFIAEHPEAFEPTVVSEIRGVSDEAGNSPFWDAVGAHFFGIDFARADYLSIVNKKFIAELMPDHPLYIPLLPRSAQAVIGKAHDNSQRAVENLQREGFRYNKMVDIFDAGPVVECNRDHIKTVRDSRRGIVGAIVDGEIDSKQYMIGTTIEDFRACRAALDTTDPNRLRITRPTARALKVKEGDPVRFVLQDRDEPKTT